MDQLTELVVDRTQVIPFTHEGKPLKARPMPLRLALRLQEPGKDGSMDVSVELMAECISECVLFADSGARVYNKEQILDGDVDAMIPLFKVITDTIGKSDAKKK